jgi:folate-binding protein YgfZ
MAVQAPPDSQSQYRALREEAGVVERSERGNLDVVGPDALEYLQGQITSDVQGLDPGRGCYAALLNPKGRILADMRILLRRADEVWLDAEDAALGVLRSKLDMYRIGRDVEIADRTAERRILSLVGPRSRALCGAKPPPDEHAFVDEEFEGSRVVVVSTNSGVDLLAEASVIADVKARLVARGATPVEPEAIEIVRIESGRPRHGLDMSDENLPGEVGLEERAVSFTKGCYVGQEPVARMHYRGHPNRRLRGLRLAEPAARGDAVSKDGKQVGAVTSTCISPELGPIALALVRREVVPGSNVAVGTGERPAEVVELPFRSG